MASLTLAQYEARVAQFLLDATTLVFPTLLLDESLRQALSEYGATNPCGMETVLICPGAAREIALDAVDGLIAVTDVWWPYTTTGGEVWPPPRVAGFKVYWDDGRPVLVLEDYRGGQPQSGDSVRLFYTRAQAIQNLDSASATTIPAFHESILVRGAAGYAATSRAVDVVGAFGSEISALNALRMWGEERLLEFRQGLQRMNTQPKSGRERVGISWALDAWDTMI